MEKKVILTQHGTCTVLIKFPVFRCLPAEPARLVPVRQTETFSDPDAAMEAARAFLCPPISKGEKP